MYAEINLGTHEAVELLDTVMSSKIAPIFQLFQVSFLMQFYPLIPNIYSDVSFLRKLSRFGGSLLVHTVSYEDVEDQ